MWWTRSRGSRSGSLAGGDLGGADRKHLLVEQPRRREAGKIAGAPADQRVDRAAVERVLDRVGVDQHVDFGMARLELADPADQPGRGERRARIDDQKPPTAGLAHRPGGAREHREAVGERRRPRRARFGQSEAAPGALDQRRADFVLEQAHLLRDGGLGDEQLLRGARERQPARDRFEGAQSVKAG